MVSKRLAHKLFKPLVDRNPDLAHFGTGVVVTPVRHIARFIWLDSVTFDRRGRGWWTARELFEPTLSMYLTPGGELQFMEPRLGPEGMAAMRTWTDADYAAWLVDRCEQLVLPKLRAITSIEDYFATFYRQWHEGHEGDGYGWILFAAVLGQFDRALRIAARYKDWIAQEPAGVREFVDGIRVLLPLLEAGDRAAVAAQLHAWEAATAKVYKMDHLHERTPFPFEIET
jgi:hypothetical protein